ncbi:TonB-dependent receptor plug domain-containing protein [Roseateles sp. BYS180W]|uniref:TonB-dependent receptor plug domain-containing protein n=1 Tax=Roseateles rivi TaxID=3299028 RepID=A0ABW7FWT6_9BURK
MRITSKQLQPSLCALAAALVCVSAHAQNQQTSEPQQLQRVEVTGSSIKRVNAETASPVQVIDRKEIEKSGANTLAQILNALSPAIAGGFGDNGNSSSFAAGASSTALRKLGTGATLVLLNGRRVANFAMANGAKDTFVNVDSFPADAIERIDILKEGASAVYGSDALAGVINVITRRNYEGVGVSANYTTSSRPKIREQATASIVAGYGNVDRDRFNVLTNLEYYQRKADTFDEVLPYYPDWHQKYVNPAIGLPSQNSTPGNFIVAGKPILNPDCPAASRNSDGLCVLNLNGINRITDPAKRLNVFSSARYVVNDSVEAFGEFSYSRVESGYVDLPFAYTYSATPFQWFDGYALKLQRVPRPLYGGKNSTEKPVGIQYRFMDPNIDWDSKAEADQYRVMAGARGQFKGWDYEAALGRTGADGSKGGRAAHRDGFTSALASGEYVIGGKNSDELLRRMFPSISLGGENSQTFVDGKISGEVYQLGGRPVLLAVGGDVRQESLKIKSSDNVMNAEMISRGSVWVEGERKLAGLFAEVEAQPIRNLTINTAARYDKVGGFAGKVSPKIGIKWAPIPQILVRSGYSEGFRAPNIPETLGKVGLTGFFNGTYDPQRCETAQKINDILKSGNATDKAWASAALGSGCSVSIPAMITANRNVKPELSNSITFGVVLEPSRNFSMSVDYWRIERTDEINYRSPSYVLGKEGQPAYDAMIARQEISEDDMVRINRANQVSPGANLSWKAGQLVTLLLGYENFGKTLNSGVDVEVSGRLKVENLGTIRTSLQTTYALQTKSWDIDRNAYRPNTVGLRGNPRMTSVFTLGWDRQDWSSTVRVTHSTRTELNFDEYDAANWSEANCARIKKATDVPCYTDESVFVNLGVAYTGIKNTSVSLNVGNLLGSENPIDLRGGYNVAPRTYRFAVSHKF